MPILLSRTGRIRCAISRGVSTHHLLCQSAARKNLIDLCVVEDLIVQQSSHQRVEFFSILLQKLRSALLRLDDDVSDLPVDGLCCVLAEVVTPREFLPKKDLFVLSAQGQGPDALVHSPVAYHRTSQRGHLFVVGLCTSGTLTENDRLRHAAAKTRVEVRAQSRLGDGVPLFSEKRNHPHRLSAGHDDGLVDRRCSVGQLGHQGVTRFVDSRQVFVLFGHDDTSPLGAQHDLVLSVLQVGHHHVLSITQRRQQSGLIDEVLQVGARQPRRSPCDSVEIDLFGCGDIPGVHLQDTDASAHIGQTHYDTPVEATRTQQRRIKDIGSVRRSHEDDAVVGLEAVHLHQ